MEENNFIDVRGEVEIIVRNADGSEAFRRRKKNLVVSLGQNLFAGLFAGLPLNGPSHIAVGSSSVAPSKSQTQLAGTEHERVLASVSAIDNTISIIATMGAGIPGIVTCAEFGLFNGASSPPAIMIARWTTPQFTLPATSTIEVIWRLTIGG